jgi:hypothetical protein
MRASSFERAEPADLPTPDSVFDLYEQLSIAAEVQSRTSIQKDTRLEFLKPQRIDGFTIQADQLLYWCQRVYGSFHPDGYGNAKLQIVNLDSENNLTSGEQHKEARIYSFFFNDEAVLRATYTARSGDRQARPSVTDVDNDIERLQVSIDDTLKQVFASTDEHVGHIDWRVERSLLDAQRCAALQAELKRYFKVSQWLHYRSLHMRGRTADTITNDYIMEQRRIDAMPGFYPYHPKSKTLPFPSAIRPYVDIAVPTDPADQETAHRFDVPDSRSGPGHYAAYPIDPRFFKRG